MTHVSIIPGMIIRLADGRSALGAIAERLTTAYWLLMERDDLALSPAMDAVFGALGSVDILAGGLTAPNFCATLDEGL